MNHETPEEMTQDDDLADIPADAPAPGTSTRSRRVVLPGAGNGRSEEGRLGQDVTPETQQHLAAIWRLVESRVGHDFSRYKPATMLRRIQRRMQVCRIESMSEYVAHLARERQELDTLYKDLLIGVTLFFRNVETFRVLSAEVIPRLFERAQDDGHIRIWVPGCATGEEVYSIAMLLREHMDRSEWSAGTGPRIQIFATDIDEDALEIARQGRYPRKVVSNLSSERLGRFFRQEQDAYVIHPELRGMCLFTTHNLIDEPPFGRLDLISCRNLLIYLERDVQTLLISLFHYALRGHGYLLLGPSEDVAAYPELFEELDRKHRIFRRQPSVERPSLPFLRAASPQLAPQGTPSGALSSTLAGTPSLNEPGPAPLVSELVERAVLEDYSHPTITVNQRFDIVYVTGPTSRYLSLPPGQPEINLMQMAKRGLRLELYTALHQALNTETPVTREATVELDGREQRVRLSIQPLSRLGGPAGLYMVVLQELAAPVPWGSSVQGMAADEAALRRLKGDLEDTRQHLKAAMEKLEIKNEELRDSNEEFLSMNEELQSANEELRASKEELEAINVEMARKLEELDWINSDLLNLFQSTHVPTIFLDHDLRIVRFTAAAMEVFRLIDSDVGRSIEDITRRFHEVDLEAVCRRMLATKTRQIMEVVRPSDGTHFIMRISPYRAVKNGVDGVVLTFADVTPIKRAEEAVRRSETRYRSLMEATTSVVWTTSADGRFTHSQPRFSAYTGQPFEAASGPPPRGWLGDHVSGYRDFGWLESVHPADREEVRQRWQQAVREGRDYAASGRIYHAESQGYRFFELRAVPIRNAAGAVEEWVGVILDVHARRSMEMALRASEERLDLAMEATELGIFDIEYRDGRMHGRVRSNENTRHIHGLPVDEESSCEAFYERLHEDDRKRVVLALRRAAEPEGSSRYEVQYRVRWPDGSIHWLAAKARAHGELRDGQPRVVRLVGTIRDITETVCAQADLERYAAQQAAVSDLGLLALREMDPQQVLDAAVALVAGTLGVPLVKVLESMPEQDELLLRAGVGWRPGAVGQVRLSAGRASQAGYTLAMRQPVVVEELAVDARFERPALLIEHNAVSGMSVIIGVPADRPWGVLSAHTRTRNLFTQDDVNFLQAVANILASAMARADAHEELRKAKQAAENASAAKDRFLAVLSHELRTPLTPVLAAASELESAPDVPERVRGWMGVIRRNVELEARLLDDLLDLTRISRGKLTLEVRPVSLQELVGQVSQICQAEARSKELTIALDMRCPASRVLADPARTLQVLWNLLNNAIKYTLPGGRIDIRCTSESDSDSEAGMARIEITDTGVGMTPELLARVFDAFEQGSGESEHGPGATRRAGLGLGLSIARALVEEQGGRIAAESPGPGLGATFRVLLPLADGEAGRDHAEAVDGAQPARPDVPLRILLVEDHEDSAEILASLLERDGARVHVAASARDALSAAAQQPFDLVISDIGLPDMPGYELFPLLREHQPSLHGVALSGYGMDEDVMRCRNAGLGEHLTKPVDFQKLRAIIRRTARS